MRGNAQYITQYLTARGWTLNAIAGMLGNMQTESTINPGIWQNLDAGNTSLGFGLVQWTPATKLIEWAQSRSLDYTHMDTQLERILYELENGLQYYPTDSYPLSFVDFSKSTESAYYLAGAFLYNYERPAEPNAVLRGNQGAEWYAYISGLDVGGGGSDAPIVTPTKPKKHQLSLMMKYFATRR